MIAAKKFKYGGKWISAGEPVSMPPDDERTHRLLGLIEEGSAGSEPTVPAKPPAKPRQPRGKRK